MTYGGDDDLDDDDLDDALEERTHTGPIGESTIQRWERLFNDPRSIAELIDAALAPDVDPFAFVRALETLQLRANREVLEAAAALCRSPIARERSLGADILGRLGNHVYMLRIARNLLDSDVEKARQDGEALLTRWQTAFGDAQQFPKEALAILLPMLDTESDDETLRDILCAVGEYQQFHPSVTERIAAFRRHPSRDVRFTVSTRLGIGIVDNDTALLALAELSDDEDEEIRWMTTMDLAHFGHYHANEATCEIIKRALRKRLDDEIDETRSEALSGLAELGDPQVVDALLAESAKPDRLAVYTKVLITAGCKLGDKRLHPLLVELQVKHWLGEANKDNKELKKALKKCRPAGDPAPG